jgi:hypothetical protein
MAKKPQTLQVKVRMTKDLHRRIQRDADRHGQTINAEILFRIEAGLKADEWFERIRDATAQLEAVAAKVMDASEEDKANDK